MDEQTQACVDKEIEFGCEDATDLVVDFGKGLPSNPAKNPNDIPGNMGCLLSGERCSVFIKIVISETGTLEWFVSDENPSGFGCLDWIMWKMDPDGSSPQKIKDGTHPPVACNWNFPCSGFTGMAPLGNMPDDGKGQIGAQTNFEVALPVNFGEVYLLNISNYSKLDMFSSLKFGGTAKVSCESILQDETICLGDTAEINIDFKTAASVKPAFEWSPLEYFENISGDTLVKMFPPATKEYYLKSTFDTIITFDTITITVLQEPVPLAGDDDTTCFVENEYMLNGTISDPDNAFYWLSIDPLGELNSADVQFSPNNQTLDPTIDVQLEGAYQFILVEDNGACDSVTDTVNIFFTPTSHTIEFLNPVCADSCDGQITIFSEQAIEYSIDDGTSWSNDSVFTSLCNTSYPTFVKDIYGCISEVVHQELKDPDFVTISVSNDTTVCENGEAHVYASGKGGKNLFYHWDFTDDLLKDQFILPIKDSLVKVFAMNENYCKSTTDSIQISVLDPISISVTPNDTVCPTYESIFQVSTSGGNGGPYLYSWVGNEGIVYSSTATLVTYNDTYEQFCVTVEDQCESTPVELCTEVHMHDVPVPLFSVDSAHGCEPFEVILKNETTLDLIGDATWYFGDGSSANTPFSTVHTFNTYGDYSVGLYVISPHGCYDSILVQDYIHVYPLPTANFYVNPNPTTMFNTTVKMDNASILASTYEWDFGPTATPSTSKESDPTVLFTEGLPGEYPITLISTTDFGCQDSLTLPLVIIPDLILYAPNTFTPDGDEYNQEWRVYIEGIDIYDFTLEIYDRYGELIWESHDASVSWDATYNSKPVEDGIYVWKIICKDQIVDKRYEFNGYVNVLR